MREQKKKKVPDSLGFIGVAFLALGTLSGGFIPFMASVCLLLLGAAILGIYTFLLKRNKEI